MLVSLQAPQPHPPQLWYPRGVYIHICVKPALVLSADEVAEKSPWRGSEARVPCSCRYGRRGPSRVLSRILGRNCQTQEGRGFLEKHRWRPQGPDLIGSILEGPRSQPEGERSTRSMLRTSNNPIFSPVGTFMHDFERWCRSLHA